MKKIAVMGAGVIGSSFALAFAKEGYYVNLYNRSSSKFEFSEKNISDSLDNLVDEGIILSSEVKNILDRITFTTSIEDAVKDVIYIQENVAETYEVKQDLIEQIEKYVSKDTIIASSTSGLLISKIAEKAQYPERIIGAHPYNPPHLIPLIELSKGDKTDDKYIYMAKDIFIDIKKEPIVLKKEALGFVANRIQAAVIREELDLILNGVVSIEDAEKAIVYGPGIRYAILGQILNFELGGGDHGIQGLIQHVGPSMELWLKDMASWTSFPEGTLEALNEVPESIANRPEDIGNTRESLKEYRDKMLIEILKLHNKI